MCHSLICDSLSVDVVNEGMRLLFCGLETEVWSCAGSMDARGTWAIDEGIVLTLAIGVSYGDAWLQESARNMLPSLDSAFAIVSMVYDGIDVMQVDLPGQGIVLDREIDSSSSTPRDARKWDHKKSRCLTPLSDMRTY